MQTDVQASNGPAAGANPGVKEAQKNPQQPQGNYGSSNAMAPSSPMTNQKSL